MPWYFGYADSNGLQEIKVDPETITVDLFYDPDVKKEISDEKTVDLWKLVNRAFNKKDEFGTLFRSYIPDESVDELMSLFNTDKKDALIFLDRVSTSIEANINGTTEAQVKENWSIITGKKKAMEEIPA